MAFLMVLLIFFLSYYLLLNYFPLVDILNLDEVMELARAGNNFPYTNKKVPQKKRKTKNTSMKSRSGEEKASEADANVFVATEVPQGSRLPPNEVPSVGWEDVCPFIQNGMSGWGALPLVLFLW